MSEVKLPAPVKATIIALEAFSSWEEGKGPPAGAIAFSGEPPEGLWYRCPCGCGSCGLLPIYGPGAAKTQKPSWAWDGNREAPTLSPSIHHIGHWHGYLRSGVFTDA